jgi:hypothetical protein
MLEFEVPSTPTLPFEAPWMALPLLVLAMMPVPLVEVA